MVDNCSIARLGSHKWTPRFDYMFTQQVHSSRVLLPFFLRSWDWDTSPSSPHYHISDSILLFSDYYIIYLCIPHRGHGLANRSLESCTCAHLCLDNLCLVMMFHEFSQALHCCRQWSSGQYGRLE